MVTMVGFVLLVVLVLIAANWFVNWHMKRDLHQVFSIRPKGKAPRSEARRQKDLHDMIFSRGSYV